MFERLKFKGRSSVKTEKEGKFDQACGDGIDHRLTRPGTPKTNGMVERVNLTIKTATIHKTSYDSYDSLEKHLMEFLVFYNTNRRHESLVKELKVKTPFGFSFNTCLECIFEKNQFLKKSSYFCSLAWWLFLFVYTTKILKINGLY